MEDGGGIMGTREENRMMDMLISLKADLASSIAFRYACRLAELARIHLQTIYVEEVEKEGYPPGSGWVRSTWETGLLETAQREIAQLINTEKTHCPVLDEPIVRIGEREEELLREVKREAYDVFLEGVLSSSDERLFFQKMRSKLYRQLACPIILVKNLVNPARVALVLAEHKDVKPLVNTFANLFEKSKLSVDLVYVKANRNVPAENQKIPAGTAGPEWEDARHTLDDARERLAFHGWTPQESWILQERPQTIGEMLAPYGLVGSRLPHAAHKSNMVMDLLSRVSSATLLARN